MSLRSWVRFFLAVSICAALSAPAFGQGPYGGGGGTGGTTTSGGTPVYNKSYGNTGAIVGGIAGGAGAALVAYMVYHKATMTACVEQAADGFKVMDQKGNTYAVDTNGETLKAGEQFKLTGKKKADKSGARTFRLSKSPEDLGPCSKETEAKAQTQ